MVAVGLVSATMKCSRLEFMVAGWDRVSLFVMFFLDGFTIMMFGNGLVFVKCQIQEC